MQNLIKAFISAAMALSPAVALAQSNVPPPHVTQMAPELAPRGSQPVQAQAAPGTTESLALPPVPGTPNAAAEEAAQRREAAKVLKEQKKLQREQKKQERIAAMEQKKAEREAKRAERKKKAEEREAKRKDKMQQNLPKFGRPETSSTNNNNSM